MTYSSLSDAVTGFKSDADRVDTFGNGDANATYTSKTGAIVPSIQNLIGQWNYSINVAANGILAQSTAQAGIATTQAGNAATSAGAAAMTKAAIDSRYYPNSATDPTTRPDGSARQSGDRYFNTASSVEKVYDGATWTIAALGGWLIICCQVFPLSIDLTNLNVVVSSPHGWLPPVTSMP